MESKGEGTAARVVAVTTQDVLLAEYMLLGARDAAPPEDLAGYYRQVQAEGQAALCLSGGGIRSAAFALGVLQALSRKRLLTGFRYLSTVSGGGYIGSWLQRWIHEEKGDAETVMVKLGGVREPDQIKRLRENSNFLTPRAGLGSNDTWTAVALTLRNIVINWFLFLPLLLIVAVFPNWFLSGVDSVPTAVHNDPWFELVLLGVAGAAIAVSVANTVPMLPSYRKAYDVAVGRGDSWIFVRIVLPIIVWAVAGTLALSAVLIEGLNVRDVKTVADPLDGNRVAGITLIGMILGLFAGAFRIERKYLATLIDDLIVWPLSFVVAASWVWLGAGIFNRFVAGEEPGRAEGVRQVATDWSAALLTTLGPLWLMSATLVAAIFFTAFRRSDGAEIRPDSDREWIARLSGIKFKPMLGWALAGFSALLLMELLQSWGDWDLTISGVVALVAGSGAVAGGKSQRGGGVVGGGGGRILRVLPFKVALTFATLVFIVALFVLLAGLENRLVQAIEPKVAGWLQHWEWPAWIDARVASHTVLLVLLVAVLLILQRMIPVNRFSLNGLYRNRLAKGFLGAARDPAERKPNPFTGFDSADNVRLAHLVPKPGRGILYPVINAALNVTASEKLAWQERKAQPFVFTPLYSGGGMLDPDGLPPRQEGAYVVSSEYAGNERDIALGRDEHGVTLATAMSISGAAASPNMGYHSSAATAFLMTLFNVRLGAWLPNPARAATLKDKLRQSSPRDSLFAILGELAGSTTDRNKSVYLSDGGHFENLGIYEMLRRRCRYILVSDAAADPDCAFADLGNAVRKAKIDLDIDVDFGRTCISARRKDIEPQLAWAMGLIRYPEGSQGTIIYVKPSFFGKHLPVDVVAYGATSEAFPHESTADQWFSESQFESYRRLGEHFAAQIGVDTRQARIPEFFERAFREYSKVIGTDSRDRALMRALRAQLAWRPEDEEQGPSAR